jgi:hypothetical protein
VPGVPTMHLRFTSRQQHTDTDLIHGGTLRKA